MALPTPIGIHQIASGEKYALVEDLNRVGITTDAALTFVKDRAEYLTDKAVADAGALSRQALADARALSQRALNELPGHVADEVDRVIGDTREDAAEALEIAERAYEYNQTLIAPAAAVVNAVVTDPATPAGSLVADRPPRSEVATIVRDGTGMIAAADHGLRSGATATENRDALAAALAEASARGGLTVKLPAGQHEVAPVDLSQFKPQLQGVGGRIRADQRAYHKSAAWSNQKFEGTVLRAAPGLGEDKPFLLFPHSSASDGSTLTDLTIIGTGTGVGLRQGWLGPDGKLGSAFGHPVRTRLQNVNIANFSHGIQTTAENSVYIAPYIVGCGVGFAAGYPFNGNVVVGINVEMVSVAAVILDHAITNRFMGGVIQANKPTLGGIVVQNSSHENVFESIYIENHNGDPTYVAPVYDARVGDTNHYGTGFGICYGNAFLDCHFGSIPSQNPKIRVRNAVSTRFTSRHSGSTTPNPTLELAGGYGHEVVGFWPNGIVGAAVPRSRIMNWSGADAGVTEVLGHHLSVAGDRWVGTGSMPLQYLPTAQRGALMLEGATGALMCSDGTGWAPVGGRVVARNAGPAAAGGMLSLEDLVDQGVSHFRVSATGSGATVRVPKASARRTGRSLTIHNSGGQEMSLVPSEGNRLNGGATPVSLPGSGTVTIFCESADGWVRIA